LSAPETAAGDDDVADGTLDVLGDRDGPVAWVEYLVSRGLFGALTRLPHGLQEGLLSLLARAARAFDRRRSDSARIFLRQALGCARAEQDLEARVLAAWKHLFRVTLDTHTFALRVDPARVLERFTIEECPGLREALGAGRGGIIACPHLGNWEAGSAMLPAMGFRPLHVVARPPKNRPLSAHLHRARLARGIGVLPRRGGMAEAARLLKAGAWIALLPDQRPRKRWVMAPFFGRPARCERGVTALARRLDVPLVVASCTYEGAPLTFRTRFARVFWPAELAGLSSEESTALLNRELERLILAAPDQYFWLHDRYRGEPAPAVACPTPTESPTP
jgi:Kdo2-lipid IVA lauroyltransferase/acyltransferase